MAIEYKAEVSLCLTPHEALLVKSIFQNTPEYLSNDERGLFHSIFEKLPEFGDIYSLIEGVE